MKRLGSRRTLAGLATAALAVSGFAGVSVATAAPALADGPGSGAPWVVSLGDSAISGEAGRWAGSTNGDPARVDALGPTAYYDNANQSAEQITGCHRSKSAEIHIGGGINSLNLACSGAKTYTSAYDPDEDFKPGIDFYDDGAGHQGQTLMLREFAKTHNVTAIPLLIGANNYHFADLVKTCVADFLLSPSWWPNYCNDDSSVKQYFTPSYVQETTNNVIGALHNVRQAMTDAGYSDGQYTILLQTYWNPVPRGSQVRYKQSGYTRQTVGGCGLWDADFNWANDTAFQTMNQTNRNAAAASGMSNVRILDISKLTEGHRLCENTVGLLEEKGVSSWRAPGASDKTEWINEVRTATTVFGPYLLQEDLHANYWGQLAMRNCFRQAYNGGAPRGGLCTAAPGGGVDAQGEPNVVLG